jgi:hypothetical protein
VLNITLAVLVQVSCVIHPRPTHVHWPLQQLMVSTVKYIMLSF